MMAQPCLIQLTGRNYRTPKLRTWQSKNVAASDRPFLTLPYCSDLLERHYLPIKCDGLHAKVNRFAYSC